MDFRSLRRATLLACAALLCPATGRAAPTSGNIKALRVRVLFKDAKNALSEAAIARRLNGAKINFAIEEVKEGVPC